MNNLGLKILLIIIGIIIISIGGLLSFGILISSLKEGDDFHGFYISFGLIGIGLIFIIKGIKIKNR